MMLKGGCQLSLSTSCSFRKRPLCMRATAATSSTKAADQKGQANFYSLSVEELSQKIKPFPTYRSNQIRNWVYHKGVTDFSKMNNLPQELRENLKRHFSFGHLSLEVEQVSQKDATIKRAYKLPDGQLIESVLMPYEDGRRTACISSQAGCAMGCVFCATGQMVSCACKLFNRQQ